VIRTIIPCASLLTVIATGACSPPNRLFQGAEFPAMTELYCEVSAIQTGVMNPTYFRDTNRSKLTLTITDMEPGGGTAKLSGNNDFSRVEFRPSVSQLQFVETTASGNLTLTTVFAPPAAGEPMPVVGAVRLSPAR